MRRPRDLRFPLAPVSLLPPTLRPAFGSSFGAGVSDALNWAGNADYVFDFQSNMARLPTGTAPVTSLAGWTTSGSPTLSSAGLSVTGAQTAFVSGLSIPASPFTLFVDGSATADDGVQKALAQLDDGSLNNRIFIFRDTANALIVTSVTGGVGTTNTGPAQSGAFSVKAAGVQSANTVKRAFNGTPGTAAAATDPVGPLTRIQFGSRTGFTTCINGVVRRVAIFTRALSDAELVALTT